MPATILLLVGTSSAGKSSLATELQAILPEHYLLIGIDDVFRMVSPRWGGGMGGPLSYHGFRYNRNPNDATVTIEYGDVGRAVLEGMHLAVAGFAQAGTNIIVDDMLLDRSVLAGWASALAPYPAYLINVQASLAALEAREPLRRSPPGLARGHYDINALPFSDLLIDTTHKSPQQAASDLVQWLQTNPEATALQHYRK